MLQIVSTDDYMPMRINNLDEYDKVIDVSWYKPDKPREEIMLSCHFTPTFYHILTVVSFPCEFPFSQMYPLCCIDICNFLNQFCYFSDDHFQNPSIIDDTLKTLLDSLLSENVCNSLVERLSVQYLSQIVQILVNLEHFETACLELEKLLVVTRNRSPSGPIVLNATEKFRINKKTAEKRIFELVNSKIDDLLETAVYDWYQPFFPGVIYTNTIDKQDCRNFFSRT